MQYSMQQLYLWGSNMLRCLHHRLLIG